MVYPTNNRLLYILLRGKCSLAQRLQILSKSMHVGIHQQVFFCLSFKITRSHGLLRLTRNFILQLSLEGSEADSEELITPQVPQVKRKKGKKAEEIKRQQEKEKKFVERETEEEVK